MNSYNPASLRSTVLAAVCAIIVSSTFLTGALAPAAGNANAAYTTVA